MCGSVQYMHAHTHSCAAVSYTSGLSELVSAAQKLNLWNGKAGTTARPTSETQTHAFPSHNAFWYSPHSAQQVYPHTIALMLNSVKTRCLSVNQHCQHKLVFLQILAEDGLLLSFMVDNPGYLSLSHTHTDATIMGVTKVKGGKSRIVWTGSERA